MALAKYITLHISRVASSLISHAFICLFLDAHDACQLSLIFYLFISQVVSLSLFVSVSLLNLLTHGACLMSLTVRLSSLHPIFFYASIFFFVVVVA